MVEIIDKSNSKFSGLVKVVIKIKLQDKNTFKKSRLKMNLHLHNKL